MVMFWSRSDWRASMRLAHSKGTPRRSAISWSCSSLPSGSEPVSWNSRPTSVDLPWSTWPTMTILSCSVGVTGDFAICWDEAVTGGSHVAIAPEFFKGVLAFFVLSATGAFGRFGGAQLGDDFRHGASRRVDGRSAGRATEAAIALAFAVGKIEWNHRNFLALDVFPYVQFGPVE